MSVDHFATRDAALARMSDLLDRAAEQENVSPEAFRAEIAKAMEHTHARRGEIAVGDRSAEAFVLSLVQKLF